MSAPLLPPVADAALLRVDQVLPVFPGSRGALYRAIERGDLDAAVVRLGRRVFLRNVDVRRIFGIAEVDPT